MHLFEISVFIWKICIYLKSVYLFGTYGTYSETESMKVSEPLLISRITLFGKHTIVSFVDEIGTCATQSWLKHVA